MPGNSSASRHQWRSSAAWEVRLGFSPGAARGISSQRGFNGRSASLNIRRAEQVGDNTDPPGTSEKHFVEVLQLNSADAENRQTYFRMSPPDVRKADRRIVRFRGRWEYRAESNVVRTFALRCARLLEAVRRFSNQNGASCFA